MDGSTMSDNAIAFRQPRRGDLRRLRPHPAVSLLWIFVALTATLLVVGRAASQQLPLNDALSCVGASVCADLEVGNTSALYCDGASACSGASVGVLGHLECTSESSYVCYQIFVGVIQNFTNLSCVSDFACMQASFGTLGGDNGAIICQGNNACVDMTIDNAPTNLKLECLGSDSVAYGCCEGLVLSHIDELTCSGMRACDGLVVESVGTGSEVLHCAGEKSCYSSNFGTVLFSSIVCEGTESCGYMEVNNHSSVSCDGDSACHYTVMGSIGTLSCQESYACYFVDVVSVTTLLCGDGTFGCSRIDASYVGFLNCTSSSAYVSYVCYEINVMDLGNPSSLSCIGAYACDGATFGTIGANLTTGSAFLLRCQGIQACVDFSVDNWPAQLDVECLGSGSTTYAVCDGLVLDHVNKLTCNGIRACDGLSVRSIGDGSETLVCTGQKACYAMDLIATLLESVVCSDEMSCAYIGLGNLSSAWCIDEYSCYYSTMGVFEEVACLSRYSCYFLVIDSVDAIQCNDDYACSRITANYIGALNCTSSSVAVDYLCYEINIDILGNPSELNCIGDFACTRASFGLLGSNSTNSSFVLTCEGSDACVGLSADIWPSKLELHCQGSGSLSYGCCWGVVVDHLEALICEGSRACHGLSVQSLGNGSVDLMCSGIKSCYDLDAPRVNSVTCDGENACYSMQLANVSYLDCLATSACYYAEVDTVGTLRCDSDYACYFAEGSFLSDIHCSGKYACASMNLGTVGHLRCSSTSSYVCYRTTVESLPNQTELSCFGPYACKELSLANVGVDDFVLNCHGPEACLKLSFEQEPPALKLNCLGSADSTLRCCGGMSVAHVASLTCSGIRACDSLTVGSIGNGTVPLECTDSKACYFMTIGNHSSTVTCTGATACGYAQFGQIQDFTCGGDSACTYAVADAARTVSCVASYACYFTALSRAEHIVCEGYRACGFVDIASAGFINCSSPDSSSSYLCAGAAVGVLDASHLVCSGNFNCKSASFGTVTARSFQLICAGSDACVGLSIEDTPRTFEVQCLGAATSSYKCCSGVTLKHVKKLTCSGIRACEGLTVASVGELVCETTAACTGLTILGTTPDISTTVTTSTTTTTTTVSTSTTATSTTTTSTTITSSTTTTSTTTSTTTTSAMTSPISTSSTTTSTTTVSIAPATTSMSAINTSLARADPFIFSTIATTSSATDAAAALTLLGTAPIAATAPSKTTSRAALSTEARTGLREATGSMTTGGAFSISRSTDHLTFGETHQTGTSGIPSTKISAGINASPSSASITVNTFDSALIANTTPTSLSVPSLGVTKASTIAHIPSQDSFLSLDICTKFPCSNKSAIADAVPWNSQIVAVATIHNDSVNLAVDKLFGFTLTSMQTKNIVWSVAGRSRFATFFTGSPVFEPMEVYTLSVTLQVAGHLLHASLTIATSTPPILHGIDLFRVSSSPAQFMYRAFANASSVLSVDSSLQYQFQLVGYPTRSWAFEVAHAPTNDSVVLLGVPSTRDFFLQVTVTDAVGSSTSCGAPSFDHSWKHSSTTMPMVLDADRDTVICPVEANSVLINSSLAEFVVADVLQLFAATNASTSSSAFLAAVDVLASVDLSINQTGLSVEGMIEQLLYAFGNHVLVGGQSSTVSQNVAVLYGFASLGTDSWGANLLNDISTTVTLVGESLVLSGATAAVVTEYFQAVDAYASSVGSGAEAKPRLLMLDAALNSACVALQAGAIPSAMSSKFNGSFVSLDCSKSQIGDHEAVVMVGDGISVAGPPNTDESETITIAVTTWHELGTNANQTDLLSNIHGIHVTSDADGTANWITDPADGFTLSVDIDVNSGHGNDAVLRTQVSCRYVAEDNGVWSSAGVYLIGLAVQSPLESVGESSLQVSALCHTAHFTLFAIEDSSKLANAVAEQITHLSGRVESMASVDLLDGHTEVNWPVPLILGLLTIFVAAVVIVSHTRGRKHAVDVARHVFVRSGALARPRVLGSEHQEAIVRGWLAARPVGLLLMLHLFTTNPFLGLLFRWSHEAVVFTQADKATNAYAAVLMSFLTSAFFFDTSQSQEDTQSAPSDDDFVDALLEVLISSAATTLLLLPFKHIIPYMIANINTITTSTTVPTGLLQRKENKIKKRLSRWCCAAEKANYARRCHERDVLARIVSAWVDLTAHGRLENASQWPRPAQSTHGVFEILRSTTAPDELCTEGREEEATSLPAAGLFFANCYEIVLPNPMTSLQLQEREAKALSARVESSLTQWARAGMKRFRDRARLRHQYRGRLRRAEFDAWYSQCQGRRRVLAVLSYTTLSVLVLLTFTCCVLLSASFTVTECLMWAQAVGESVLMQAVVVDPLVTLAVLSVRLFASWMLLRTRRTSFSPKPEGSHRQSKRAAVVPLHTSETSVSTVNLMSHTFESSDSMGRETSFEQKWSSGDGDTSTTVTVGVEDASVSGAPSALREKHKKSPAKNSQKQTIKVRKQFLRTGKSIRARLALKSSAKASPRAVEIQRRIIRRRRRAAGSKLSANKGSSQNVVTRSGELNDSR